MKLIPVFIVMLSLLSGCGVMQPRIPGSGIMQTEFRQLPPFDEIELSGFGTVNVVAGQQQSLQVTTDDNLLGWVETEVRNGKLQIRPTRNIRPTSELVVDVTVPNLNAAHISGAGDLNVDGVVADHLDLSISGAGEITARGQVQHVSTKISGAGSANLQELVAASARVKVSGAGDVEIFATDVVDAQISGAGSVICYGHPADLKQKISGSGRLEIR